MVEEVLFSDNFVLEVHLSHHGVNDKFAQGLWYQFNWGF